MLCCHASFPFKFSVVLIAHHFAFLKKWLIVFEVASVGLRSVMFSVIVIACIQDVVQLLTRVVHGTR
jgi:hypothetical protein